MLYRTLGRTGYSVSALGLGGHTYDIGPGKFSTHEQRAELVSQLLAGGVNYFDTTWFHEVELLADSFRRLKVDPGRVHISLQHVDGMSDPDWPRKLRSELTSRLNVLGLKKAPLFLMGTGNGKPSADTMLAAIRAMNGLRADGLIDHVGVSCHEFDDFDRLASVIEIVERDRTRGSDDDGGGAGGGVDYLMLRYNFKYRQAEERLIPLARSLNIGVIAMLVFCWDCGPGQWGRRISVFEPATPTSSDNIIPALSTGNGSAPPLTSSDRTSELSAGTAYTPAQQNLRWILQQPGIVATVPAINTPAEAAANLAAASDLATPADTTAFAGFLNRLWSRPELERLAAHAESADIRKRAAALLIGDGAHQP